ncbi:MAG: DNA translocase FtsK 4TM domain-containing protein [Bacillota bacterium]
MGGYRPDVSRVRREITGIFLLAASLLVLICLFRPSAGLVACYIEKTFRVLVGDGRYLLPVLFAFGGIKLIIGSRPGSKNSAWGGAVLFLVSVTTIHIFHNLPAGMSGGAAGSGGGLLGAAIYFVFYKSFGLAGMIIIVAAFLLAGILLCADVSLLSVVAFITGIPGHIRRLMASLENFLFETVPENEDIQVIVDGVGGNADTIPFDQGGVKKDTGMDEGAASGDTGSGGPAPVLVRAGEFGLERLPVIEGRPDAESAAPRFQGEFKLPSLSLLSRPPRVRNLQGNKDISQNIKKLEETLESFGVRARVIKVSRGPAITRYEIQPPPGIKVSRIVGLADDIALSMASPDVRIEAPIPGKAAVGIEVPNVEITTVHLRELLETGEFREAASRLVVVLGKDIAGNPIMADLTRMPHLLIAGATGSGKSVCLNTMISGILFKAVPEQVKFLIIDPKMVELATYNGIPHLISPVVTDPKKAATALRWTVKEMECRYELFAAAGVRDITRYNDGRTKKDPSWGPLPYIVVIIDELADLMMVAPADVEDSICRLAQMARAAGIHLVIATQRPSVDVITGLIKANIPSRVSFAVSSQVDSRTILDMGGAEKLLGKGDMLFFPVGAPKPIRVQGAYLSDREVEALVSFWKKQAQPVYDESIVGEMPKVDDQNNTEDEMLARAVEIFIETGHASISLLQRRLRIGYSRAARLIDIMEKRNIVGSYEGSKPRAVLMTLEQYESTFKDREKKKYM